AGLDGGAVPLGAKPLIVRVGVHRGATARFAFSSPPSLSGGDYFLVARVDPTATRTGDESVVVVAQKPTAFIQPLVDLTAQIVAQPSQAVFASPAQPGAGSVTVLVFNAGNTPAAGTLSVSVYASAEPTFKSSAPVIGQRVLPRFVLRGGRSKAVSVPMTIPAGTAAGSYHLFAQINPSGGIVESNPGNNIASTLTPLVVTNTPPAPASGHRGGQHHHGSYGFDAVDVAFGVGIGMAVDDGSSDEWIAAPPDAGTPDGASGDTGDSSEDTTPTSEPTTQPGEDNSSSADSGADSSGDSNGGDFDSSGGTAGGDFGSTDSGGDSGGD